MTIASCVDVNATAETHHVFRAVPQRAPGVAVVAHHDLVGGHPVAPVGRRTRR